MNDFYTTAQVAELLGTTVAALRNWLKRNPQYRPQVIAHVALWKQSDIDRVAVARLETAANAAHRKKERKAQQG